jgi:hypothetical protein
VDQPSTRFGSFNTPQITKVGIELDHKLAALLEHLEAPVPVALTKVEQPRPVSSIKCGLAVGVDPDCALTLRGTRRLPQDPNQWEIQ